MTPLPTHINRLDMTLRLGATVEPRLLDDPGQDRPRRVHRERRDPVRRTDRQTRDRDGRRGGGRRARDARLSPTPCADP